MENTAKVLERSMACNQSDCELSANEIASFRPIRKRFPTNQNHFPRLSPYNIEDARIFHCDFHNIAWAIYCNFHNNARDIALRFS